MARDENATMCGRCGIKIGVAVSTGKQVLFKLNVHKLMSTYMLQKLEAVQGRTVSNSYQSNNQKFHIQLWPLSID